MLAKIRELDIDDNLNIKIDKIYVNAAKKNIELLHKEDDGYICLAGKDKNKKWCQYHYKVNDLNEHIGKAVNMDANIYITPNSFYRPFRKIENIRHLNALYIDIDYYNTDKYANLDHEYVMESIYLDHFENGILPEPTFAIYTGHGLAYYWLIDSCPIGVLPLWNVCQRYFAEKLEDAGSDMNSIDSARVMKIAGSYHTGTEQRAKLYIYDQDLIYNLGEIQKDYLPELNPDTESIADRVHKRKHLTSEEYYEKIKNNAIKKSRTRNQSKVLKLYNLLNLHYTRLMDLVKLQELREGYCRNSRGELIETGDREFMCFLYRYWYCLYSNDLEQALESTLEFNQNFKAPLLNKEVIEITVSAVKAYEQWSEDEKIKNDKTLSEDKKKELMGNKKYSHKGYNYNNSTLIKKLHITEEEQKELKTIISATEKKRRKNIKEQLSRRNEDGLTKRKAQHLSRIEEIQKLYEQGYKQVEIAKTLGIDKGTVSRNLKKIKQLNIDMKMTI